MLVQWHNNAKFVWRRAILRKDIFDILDYAGKFEDIVITTNGTLLDEDKCKKLSTYNNIKLSISLDGLEETHDKFRRRKGAFKKLLILYHY